MQKDRIVAGALRSCKISNMYSNYSFEEFLAKAERCQVVKSLNRVIDHTANYPDNPQNISLRLYTRNHLIFLLPYPNSTYPHNPYRHNPNFTYFLLRYKINVASLRSAKRALQRHVFTYISCAQRIVQKYCNHRRHQVFKLMSRQDLAKI